MTDDQAVEPQADPSVADKPAGPSRGQQRRAEEMAWLGRSGYSVCCGGGRGRKR